MTPIPRYNYRLGIDSEGLWREVLNTDAAIYGGSGLGEFRPGAFASFTGPRALAQFDSDFALPWQDCF